MTFTAAPRRTLPILNTMAAFAVFSLRGGASHGRHRHSTLSAAATDCRSLGVHTVILLPLLSIFGEYDSVARGQAAP
jgi:hypothetical protein